MVRIAAIGVGYPRDTVPFRRLVTNRHILSLFSSLLLSLSLSPQSTFLSIRLHPMGRQSWCTPEQAAFLETFIPRLDKEKAGNGLTPFYKTVAEEFFKLWKSPTPKKAAPEGADPQKHADNARAQVSTRA